MAAPTKYDYTPLDTSLECIRLIKVHNDPQSDTVNGQIQTFPLAQCPPYVALSYTWGDPNGPVQAIHVDGKRLNIRRNLWSFLRTFNHDDAVLLFWIDAICIDQSSHTERNHQVNLMRIIFTQATRVVAWLGEADSRSDLAIDYIASGAESGYDLSSPVLHLAVEDLLEREYWSRVWIVQEVMLARDIVFLCGPRKFTRDQINRVRRDAKSGGVQEDTESVRRPAEDENTNDSLSRLFLPIRDTPGWRILAQRFTFDTLPQHERQLPLLKLLDLFGKQQSTDVKDRVYGLLGLATEESVRVDYGSSVEDIYVDVLRTVLESSEPPNFNDLIHIENMLHRALRLRRDLRTRDQHSQCPGKLDIRLLISDLRQRVEALKMSPLPSISHLASTYYAQNRPDKVLELYGDTLGEFHHATLETMESVASIYHRQGRLRDAEELWVRFLKVRKEALRGGDPSSLKIFESLKSAYYESGRGRESFLLTRKLLGEEHADTIRALETLKSRYDEPGTQSHELFHTLRELLGEEHPETIRALETMESRYDESRRQFYMSLQMLKNSRRCEALNLPEAPSLPLFGSGEEPGLLGGDRRAILDLLISDQSVAAKVYELIDASRALESAYRQSGRHRELFWLLHEIFGREYPGTVRALEQWSLRPDDDDYRDLFLQTRDIFGKTHHRTHDALRQWSERPGDEDYESLFIFMRNIWGESHPHTIRAEQEWSSRRVNPA